MNDLMNRKVLMAPEGANDGAPVAGPAEVVEEDAELAVLMKEAGVEGDIFEGANLVEKRGKFFESLNRSFKNVRADRAAAVVDDVEIEFKRCVENLWRDIKRLNSKKLGLLDLSSSNALTIKSVEDIKPEAFVAEYVKVNVDLRKTKIQYLVARKAYNELFGTK